MRACKWRAHPCVYGETRHSWRAHVWRVRAWILSMNGRFPDGGGQEDSKLVSRKHATLRVTATGLDIRAVRGVPARETRTARCSRSGGRRRAPIPRMLRAMTSRLSGSLCSAESGRLSSRATCLRCARTALGFAWCSSKIPMRRCRSTVLCSPILPTRRAPWHARLRSLWTTVPMRPPRKTRGKAHRLPTLQCVILHRQRLLQPLQRPLRKSDHRPTAS
jgi:hypothetical protein